MTPGWTARSDFENASAILAEAGVLGRKCTIKYCRKAIRSPALEFWRVLKQINGEGVREIVVKEETVKPL